ncbi:transcriptional regulator [Vibrio sp. HA2012]|uniref:transcriptional regulator n=1 Tax=Vibrio sp. HA2012 TaxID=1971595 RepID=UPI000C2C5F7E|nr:transcriptional regulator [Vibrio sp. HA2012]PJC85491.1 transcriptional regulator [Vibrio sp. HA2012]
MSNAGTKFVLSQRFIFDPNSNTLVDKENDNETVRLGTNESRILMMFSERPNEVISRDQLHEFVWREQGFQVDDSSLTQAISTLRKNLNDSTKAPEFIKTVPKRGYQFISTVERTSILATGSKPVKELPEPASSGDQHNTDTDAENTATLAEKPFSPTAEIRFSADPALKKKTLRQRFCPQTKYIFILALLLPFFILAVINPAPSKFRLIDTIDDIPLKTTHGHPPLDSWKPLIRACYQSYAARFPDKEKPQEIIVTAGAQRNLILNYIHPEGYSFKNITVHLFANQAELSELCQSGAEQDVK